jgi:hypothetical protein
VRAAWIWGARVDLAVFGGAVGLSLLLAALGPLIAPSGAVPLWGWVAFVVLCDVAHVHTTLFRTYFDRDELRRRPVLYAAIPLACWAGGAALHALGGSNLFWRALAYVAVTHFVRQQAGWVAIYRARGGEKGRLGRVLDDAAIYAGTGFPLLWWHTHLPRPFRWFVDGDFVDLSFLEPLVVPAGVLTAAILVAYAVKAGLDVRAGRWNPGKHLVVAGTALVWNFGIVWRQTDWSFTLTNVVHHGVPYFALLWAYTKERGKEAPASAVGRVAAVGIGAFLGVAMLLAFAEEALWDRLVWHDRSDIFGGDRAALGALALSVVVPLLAVPQATHYVLDAFLWRRRDTGPAQARALGF